MKKLKRKHHSQNFTFGLFVFNIFKIPVRRYSEKPEHFSQETFPNAPGGSRTFQRARAVVYFTCERRFMSLLMDGAAIPGGMGEPGPPGALVSSPRPCSQPAPVTERPSHGVGLEHMDKWALPGTTTAFPLVTWTAFEPRPPDGEQECVNPLSPARFSVGGSAWHRPTNVCQAIWASRSHLYWTPW